MPGEGRKGFQDHYKGHMDKTKVCWKQEREVVLAGMGWRDGEKRHTTVIE